MKNKCPNCDKLIQRKIGDYWYKESGLYSVNIQNIPIYECNCGTVYPSIFRVGYLNDLIALVLLEKHSLLNGGEIKFLRKNIHFPSKKFASTLGVGNTTFSKWENDLQNHSETNDRLIRTTYMVYKGIKIEDSQKILKNLSQIRLEETKMFYQIIAEFYQDDYKVRLQQISKPCTQKSEMVLLNIKGSQPTHAGESLFSSGILQMDIKQIFSSNKILEASSERQYASEKTEI